MALLRSVVAVVLICTVASCAWVSKRVDVRAVDHRKPVQVKSAVKAHLKDGSTVTYPSGVTVTADALEGAGARYDLTLTRSIRVSSVPLDEVVGMETYRTAVNVGETLIISTLTTVATVYGTVALMIAVFGSCPTVYSGDGRVEEAELFSSSIAPLFEGRDLDVLKAQPDAMGLLSLDIRNEAMETHYLNHLQLLEVPHEADEVIMPDTEGAPLALGRVQQPATAVDRSGRDVTALLATADNRFYVTERAALDRASAADMDDWIDLTVPVPAGSTSAALAFRMRNSLLNTVLLYDVMLGPAGAGALDWIGGDLANISTAVELGRWHQRRAGLHVSVWQDGRYQEAIRVPDSGPISWHDIAAVVPVPVGETTLRIRLSFLADHWRIDHLGVSVAARHVVASVVPLAGVRGPTGKVETDGLSNMAAPDSRYLQTSPGHRFFADFRVDPAPKDRARTYLLSSQGYYTEWIRGAWIEDATVAEPFTPGDAAVLAALRKWSVERDTFERRFLTARVPVQ